VSHIWRSHGEGKNHNPNIGFTMQRVAWNKGLSKESDERVKHYADQVSRTLKQQIKQGIFKPRRMGAEQRQKTSIRQTLHNNGGRCKWFQVGSQKVQGTWERNIALICNSLSIEWKKLKTNSDIFYYTIDNIKRRYTPDFYLAEVDRYIEIKGYWWGNDQEKMKVVFEQNPSLKEKCIIVQQSLYNQLIQCETREDFLKLLM
jgi:hypothetical protein